MISVEYYDTTAAVSATVPREEAAASLGKPGITWIDADDPDEEELNWLAATAGLPRPVPVPLIYEQLSWDDDLFAFTLNGVRVSPDGRTLLQSPVTIVARPTLLMTVKYRAPAALQTLRRQWSRGRLGDRPLAYCTYLAADSILETYLTATNRIEGLIDDLRRNGREDMMSGIFRLRTQLYLLLRLLRPYRMSFNALLRITEGKTGFPIVSSREYYENVARHLRSINEEIYLSLNIVGGIIQENENEQTDRLNDQVSKLTLIGIVLATFEVLIAMFSIQLRELFPNLRPLQAILIIFGALAGIAGLEVLVFRKKGLIR